MYQPIIGMEIHVELRTNTKMFCGCPADHFGIIPNTHTCPVCLGMPGALPVPNKKAVTWTQMIGLALRCSLAKNSKFDRKHYFYPDLPKGYQISQYDEPLCFKGRITTSSGEIRITRVHLEEDTGKLQHAFVDGKSVSLVDFNRGGVALVEIVTEPDIRSASQAKEYAQAIQKVVRFLGISDADMEKGSMRLEANISLSKDGSLPNYKVEVKNLNSFRFLEKAIEFEIKRQTEILSKGNTPPQETRGFSESKMATFSQRTKETSEDYRYFPDPDIPPLSFTDKDLDKVKHSMPILPNEYTTTFTKDFGIRNDFIAVLTSNPEIAQFALNAFKRTVEEKIPPMTVASYLVNKKIVPNKLSLDVLFSQLKKPAVTMQSDDLEQIVIDCLGANNEVVEKYKSGKTAVLGALIGDVMKRAKGHADPKAVATMLIKKLSN